MAFDYINEAFKKLDILDEAMFNASLDGINQLSDFVNDDDNTDDIIRVIDPEADTDEELQDSYVGKVIINCNVCHSHIFENKEDITIEEEGTVNVETQCPYCGEQEGFTIVGEIAPFNSNTSEDPISDEAETEESSVEEIPSEDVPEESELSEGLLGTVLAAGAGSLVGNAIANKLSEEEGVDNSTDKEETNEALGVGAGLALGGAAIGAGNVISKLVDSVECEDDKEDLNENKPLRMSRASRIAMQEDFKEVSITTDDQHMEMTSDESGKVTVTTEPVANDAADETIVPVSDETEEEILSKNNIEDSDPFEDEVEFDFDEVEEEGLDELGESYLRNVYENVESFKTTSVATNSKALVVEGIIKFNSGVEKKTGFIFEAKDANSRGQLRFNGSNKHLAESTDAFNLVGHIDNKKLIVESLKYNYKVNEESVRGLVRRK